jgi:hypothetical protein
MSNYLRGLGRAVGFTEDTASRGAAGDPLDADWDEVSRASSRGDANLLRGARGPGQGLPLGGGERTLAGETYPAASPTRQERQQQWEGGGNLPRAITQNDAFDVRSNLSLGEVDLDSTMLG